MRSHPTCWSDKVALGTFFLSLMMSKLFAAGRLSILHLEILFALLLFALPMELRAQSHNITFVWASRCQSRPSWGKSALYSSASQGFMWFRTENRYVGYRFTFYKHEPGDPLSIVNAKVQSLRPLKGQPTRCQSIRFREDRLAHDNDSSPIGKIQRRAEQTDG